MSDENYPVYDGPCKKFHSEPYMTPNNFDLHFDISKVPSNILMESASNLQDRLQKLMPLSKYIHLDLDVDTVNQSNQISIVSSLSINGKGVKFL